MICFASNLEKKTDFQNIFNKTPKQFSDPAEERHCVKMGEPKLVAILIVECYPFGYYKYMSDNRACGFSVVKRCNLLKVSLLWLYLVTETPARWCIFS